jgi:hypothetical protein
MRWATPDLNALWARLQLMRYKHLIAIFAVALILFDLFLRPLSAVSMGLIVIIAVALSPWWDALPGILKSAELPGLLKVEFNTQLKNATEHAKSAGLLPEPGPEQRNKPIYELIYNDDPTLALAGLRIAIEKRLIDLAKIARLPERGRSLNTLVRELRSADVLSSEQAGALSDVIPLLNRALHSQEYDKEAADWAIEVGPKLIAGLDDRAIAAGGRREQLWGNTSPMSAGGLVDPTYMVEAIREASKPSAGGASQGP